MAKTLISSTYLPPVSYFSLILRSDEALVEREENYVKQTYRNRCCILSSHGTQALSVPVLLGSLHKTPIKEIRIDYSKRWQQVHLGAITAAYGSSPYFQYYFEKIKKVISGNNEFLLDLNMELIILLLKYLKINKSAIYTSEFEQPVNSLHDFRYRFSPKNEPEFNAKPYLQVFENENGFIPDLSIIDLIFNMGPEAIDYL